jgi:hypothetical protein
MLYSILVLFLTLIDKCAFSSFVHVVVVVITNSFPSFTSGIAVSRRRSLTGESKRALFVSEHMKITFIGKKMAELEEKLICSDGKTIFQTIPLFLMYRLVVSRAVKEAVFMPLAHV